MASNAISKPPQSGAQIVMNALADEDNKLAYMRFSEARNAAYASEMKSRCDMYHGKARAACVEEARRKIGPEPVPPPL